MAVNWVSWFTWIWVNAGSGFWKKYCFRFGFFTFCVNYTPISPPKTPIKVHVFSDSNRKSLLRKLNWHQQHFPQKAMFHQRYQKPFRGHLPAYIPSPLRQTWSIMSSSSFKDTCSSKHNCQDDYGKSSKNWCNGNILLME